MGEVRWAAAHKDLFRPALEQIIDMDTPWCGWWGRRSVSPD
jgi:hypothetical protein